MMHRTGRVTGPDGLCKTAGRAPLAVNAEITCRHPERGARSCTEATKALGRAVTY